MVSSRRVKTCIPLPDGTVRCAPRSASSRQGVARAALVMSGLVAAGLLALGCGDAASGGSIPLTIAECHELGGSPLFDPEDERPSEESCPEGLFFLGGFNEPFFGAEGGVCCAGDDAPKPVAAE